MEPFRDISAGDPRVASLRQEMDVHGYVMIRGLLPVEDLNLLAGHADPANPANPNDSCTQCW